jgi:acetolactate synthase-1/2/3 large subunit
MLGGEMVARMLRAEGVEVVFGIIDGSYVGLYSQLREHGIQLISPRHETSALHMAGAYARLTGKLGVAIASNGPGAANALPGIAVEEGEGNRVLLITSWRRSGIVNPDRGGTYQYFDQLGVTAPMTKWSGAIESFERLPEIMRRAFRMSYQGRPGVVHVTAAEDILNGDFGAAPPVLVPGAYRRTHPLAPSRSEIREAADMLLAAEKPMIHAGSGVLHAGAFEELRAVAEMLSAPVTTSWGGRAVIDERAEVAIPMNLVGVVNKVRTESDLVLALGTRFGETDWWGKPPYWRKAAEQKLIQVDIDDERMGVNKPVTLGVIADARLFLAALADELRARGDLPGAEARREHLQQYAAAKNEFRAAAGPILATPADPVHSAFVPIVAQSVFGDDAILVADGGNTAVWASGFHEVRRPRAHLSTYKFGMLGAGVGQALGAKVACPDRAVYCIIGDGAMGFHCQEIETAVRNKLAVVFIVLCDRQWGMVKFSQGMALNPQGMMERRILSANETINTDFSEIRFDLLAAAMGAYGERVSKIDDLAGALERAIASENCAVIHVDVDPVVHMWAPNLDVFKAMHQEPAGE